MLKPGRRPRRYRGNQSPQSGALLTLAGCQQPEFAGDYRINPAELHRVFPPGAELATDVSPIVSLKRDPTELERAEAASMQEQMKAVRGWPADPENSMTPQRLVPRRSPPLDESFTASCHHRTTGSHDPDGDPVVSCCPVIL